MSLANSEAFVEFPFDMSFTDGSNMGRLNAAFKCGDEFIPGALFDCYATILAVIRFIRTKTKNFQLS